jgi:PAS domain S-box-containing protein
MTERVATSGIDMVAPSSLESALSALVRLIEMQAPGMRGSVLLLDEDGVTLRHGAAPSLPAAYNAEIDGLRIGPARGSCGTAAFTARQVVVTDIATDPLWADFRDIARAHSLAACWSTPILAADGVRVLGTFAMYYGVPRAPSPPELALTATAALLAARLIEGARVGAALLERDTRLRVQTRELEERAALLERQGMEQELLNEELQALNAELEERSEAAESASRALAETEARFRVLAEAIPVQVWTATADGSLDFVTEKTAAYFGVPTAELLGSRWGAVVHPDDLARTAERWARSVRTGEPYEAEFRVCSAAGEYRWQLARALPRRDESGAVVAWFGSNTDVEERKRAEAARDAALVARSRMMSTVSHELRTPLGAISGFTDLLLLGVRGPLNGAQRDDLERVRRNARHLRTLLDDLLLLAKLEAGQLPVRAERVRVPEVLAESQAMVEPQLLAKSLRYEVACDDALDAVADGDRVRQIVVNLVANAVKFTPAGGAVRVTADAAPASGGVRVRVIDTGAGIAPDKLDAIFEPFVQVDSESTRAEGTGLGLAISRELARRMRGDLTVASEVGRGSTFTLTLPAL